ncbi:hypothetical protein GLOIN_2v1476179 [Rhizophagus irregularis DAOM 181602=DAOM 197198]|uniref:Uncharacterized protein n=1 Tax=Rhizophagus irregularis (strain DAOM 181602 / DAOM 197198 / MUCL 43194) TaxID=747089 RepID=A0A2P4QA21_RHIID|nr:hypothetical protein GLOIN_2v1476179 [Rhizophagus irregularis DAOM 181602=DAOM 197198]POG74494.1 hypothetical protein GLOIN_2v1476179 [Rhizophagus irregularis DAOM 181602=DAOM 197198]GET61275.1 hypothetical protein GLOIN_2v1476179 [Rhizophagus irregularis DAOM 181602=DAOM 197198]|eukprot:XP_025181360.1 hypothetical protein GLOIN_2v1476179 [Rhizophagus irregularis DAOM 181602=DAOM 197198]
MKKKKGKNEKKKREKRKKEREERKKGKRKNEEKARKGKGEKEKVKNEKGKKGACGLTLRKEELTIVAIAGHEQRELETKVKNIEDRKAFCSTRASPVVQSSVKTQLAMKVAAKTH